MLNRGKNKKNKAMFGGFDDGPADFVPPIPHGNGDDPSVAPPVHPRDVSDADKMYDRAIELLNDDRALMERKNKDYAGGGSFFGNFERAAAIMALYPGIKPSTREGMAVLYAMKQLDAVLWNLSRGTTTNVESMTDKLRDIGIYFGRILRMMVEQNGGDE